MIGRVIPLLTLVVSLLMVLTSGCVSKKKFLRSQSAAQMQHDSLSQALAERDAYNDSLRLALAHAGGVNEALYNTQEKLQDRLDLLQLEIDELTSNASTTVQDLRGRIADGERATARRQARLDAAVEVLSNRRARLKIMETSLRIASDSLASEACSFRQNGGRLAMIVNEDALFRPGSISRLTTAGKTLIEAIGEITLNFPEMQVVVVGHTDNRAVKRQSTDNWQYSALRAVTVVKHLTDATDLGANRVLAAGKSEFQPLESNETKEGRASNRRIELVFAPDHALFIRTLEQSLEK